MQTSLFDEDLTQVGAAPRDAAQVALAERLPRSLRLGTSSWNFPGWAGLVWDQDYPEATVSRYGLSAYAQHPLFRAVSLDRNFYRPLSAEQYAAYASQVPEDFRFLVKAPRFVSDAVLRVEGGRVGQANPDFLSPTRSTRDFVQPALEGLGNRLGALVFQLSPLVAPVAQQSDELFQRLRRMLAALPDLRSIAPDAVVAVEVRNPELLTIALSDVLREYGATLCLGLHAKMPPIAEQLPLLRALWPGPLVCRWNLNRRHGAYGYEAAGDRYSPYNQLVDPDLETRVTLARVIAGTTGAGQNAFVTISNKAEGSAPLSVAALAREVDGLHNPSHGNQ
ncbi:MAG: DUF72 domain-containing protein [Gammaproteobacteria bacterium]